MFIRDTEKMDIDPAAQGFIVEFCRCVNKHNLI